MRAVGSGTLAGREWRAAWAVAFPWLERFVYAAILYAGAVGVWTYLFLFGDWGGPGEARLARMAFIGFFQVQFVAATFLAALAYGRSLIREKDRDTIGLLVLSPLSGFEILLGKMLGQIAAMMIVLATGLPAICFLLPLGGMEPAEVLTIHVLLVGHLLAVGGICAILAAWCSSVLPVLGWACLVLFAVMGYGETDLPGAFVVGTMFRPLNGMAWLQQELVTVGPEIGAAAASVAGGTGVLLAGCLLGGLVLRSRELARHERSAEPRGWERWRRRVSRVGGSRPVRAILRPLLPVRSELARHECAVGRDGTFRLAWLALLLGFLFMLVATLFGPDWIRIRRLYRHLEYLVVPWTAAALLFAAVINAVTLSLERQRGKYEALLAANVEPDEILRAKHAGLAVRTAWFLLPPLVLALIGVLMEGVSTIWPFLVRGVLALPFVIATLTTLTITVSIRPYGPVWAVIGSVLVGVPFSAAVGLILPLSWLTLVAGGALWAALLSYGYANDVRRFRIRAILR